MDPHPCSKFQFCGFNPSYGYGETVEMKTTIQYAIYGDSNL